MDDRDLIVVAFDGECLMCSRSIRYLAEHDPRRRFRFVTLQSPLGRAMEARAGSQALSTAVVGEAGQVHVKSAAVLCIWRALGGKFRVAARIARVIPLAWRDRAYDFIANRRHRWFGKGDACALPSPALRERLLDGEGV